MLRRIAPYTVGYLLLFSMMAALLMTYPKGELHILLNSAHNPMADTLLKYYTHLAEWPLYVLGLLPLFMHRRWWVAYYAASEGVAALIVTALKYAFRMPRPLTFFEGKIADFLPVVEGVHLHHSRSFPSGHTSTFFIFTTVCLTLLALHYKDGKPSRTQTLCLGLGQTALLLSAALGGYSRIYLSQHFLLDVFVGSLIGISVPLILYHFFSTKLEAPYQPQLKTEAGHK